MLAEMAGAGLSIIELALRQTKLLGHPCGSRDADRVEPYPGMLRAGGRKGQALTRHWQVQAFRA